MADGFDSFLQQASAQLGGIGSSTMSMASSGLNTIGTGISNAPGYLSTLSQQAFQPQPQLSMQRSPTPSNVNFPTSSSGGFGSGLNFDGIFGSSQPMKSQPGPNPIGGFGSWLSGAGSSIDKFLGGTGGQPSTQQLPPLSQAKQQDQSYLSGGPAWTNKQVAQPSTMSSNIRPDISGSLSVGKTDMTLPAPGTTSVFMGEGRGQREIQNAKVVVDEQGGSFGVYTTRPAREGFTPVYGFQVAGGSQGAAQSGQFSTKALTPLVYNQWNQELAPTGNKVEADKILANPQLYSRLGAEAYGGKVQLLDKRKLGISDMMGRYDPESGNLANLVNPFGANLSKSEMANEKIPWQIEWKGDQAIQTVTPSKPSDSIFTNLNPVTSVGPKISMTSLFGTQKPPEFLTTWEYKNPLPKNYDGTDIPSLDREKVYTQTVNPAYTKFMETYVPPQYIAVKEPVGPKPDIGFDYRDVKMVSKINPEWTSYQSKISTPTTPLVNVNIPVVTTPISKQQVSSEFMLPEDVISVNAGTTPSGKSVGENVRGWFDSTFIGTKIPGSSNKPEFALIPRAGALEEKDATFIGGRSTSPVIATPISTTPLIITPIGSGGGSGVGPGATVPQLYVKDANFDLKTNLVNGLESKKTDMINTQNALISAGAKGGVGSDGIFRYEYDATNPAQVKLHESILSKQAVIDNDVSTANAIKLTPASEASATKEDKGLLGNLGSAYEGASTWTSENITKKIFPSYENTGVGLLKYGDVAVEGISGVQKSMGMKPLYEKENAYDLLPSQKFLAYNRPEGFTKTSFVYDPLTDTTKKTVVTTGGMAEDNPLGWSVRATQSGIQGAFDMPREKPFEAATWLLMPGAFKAAEGVIGTAGVKLLPRVAASPWTADVLQIAKTGMMAGFVGGEAAKVPGYTFDPLAPLTGGNEGKVFGRTIEGYDAAGKPIYASQSATAVGKRGGEFYTGAALMSAGSGLVAPYKFAYKENFKPSESHITAGARQASGYLESKLQPGVEKFYKLGDIARVLRTGERTTEITQKPSESNILSEVQNKFTTNTMTEKPPLTIPDRGAFGPAEEAPSFQTKRFKTEMDKIITKGLDKFSKSGETLEESQLTIPDRGAFGSEATESFVTKPITFAERFVAAKDIWTSAGNKDINRAASISVKSGVLPNVAMETQMGKGSIEIPKVETKVATPSTSIEKTWAETNLPTFSKWGQKFTGKGSSSKAAVTAPIEAPISVATSKAGFEDSLKFQDAVAQRNLAFAKDLSPLEQQAYESLINKVKTGQMKLGDSGVFREKGSIGAQATEAADLSITGKVVGKNRGVGDIDILSEKPEVFNKLMASEIQAILIERGYKDVGVKVISPEGRRFDFELFGKTRNILPESVSGFRNYANRAYEITAKSPEGKRINYKMDSGVDLKLYGMDQPLAPGEGKYNIRSLFTPAEERSSGFLNNLFLTPGRTPITMPKSIGETLFGPSTFRQKYKEDYLMTQEGLKYSNPMMSGATEVTSSKPTSISRLYSTYVDKMDNIRQTSRMSLSRNPSAIEENAKFGKSVWDANNIYTKFKSRYDENLASGKMTPKQKIYAEKALKNMETGLNTINSATIEMRTPSGKIERFKVSELVDKYDTKVKSQYGGQAIEATSKTMSPFEAIEARTLTSGKSAAVVTPKGMANLQLSAPGRVGTGMSVSANTQAVFAFNAKSTKDTTTDSKAGKAGSKIPASVSASSGIKIPGISSFGKSQKESLSFGSLASAISSGSYGTPSKGSASPDKSSGSTAPSGSSGSSSLSSSSIYGSSSQSPSQSSSSGSSGSSSMSSKGSYSGGSAFGAPFLAPGGGGGGGGGGRGHLSGVIKNPLAELRVASAKAFKGMFDFRLPNKLAGDVSSKLKQTQPYGTRGASGDFSRGASSSLQEAMSIGTPQSFVPSKVAMRNSKKSKPKAKSKSGKKKGTYK